jgi:hypothetical protein
VRLRHTPTAVFVSVPATLFFAMGVVAIVASPDVGGVLYGLPSLTLLPLVWWLRVRLVAGGVEVVDLRRRRLAAERVHDVLLERTGQRAWTTVIRDREGGRHRALALTALRLAPGLASAPPFGLVERARVLADHLGVPLRVVPPRRGWSSPPPPPPSSPPPPPSAPTPPPPSPSP